MAAPTAQGDALAAAVSAQVAAWLVAGGSAQGADTLSAGVVGRRRSARAHALAGSATAPATDCARKRTMLANGVLGGSGNRTAGWGFGSGGRAGGVGFGSGRRAGGYRYGSGGRRSRQAFWLG